jgi:cobalt-zinc-cadmium efflux system outer membrane protein
VSRTTIKYYLSFLCLLSQICWAQQEFSLQKALAVAKQNNLLLKSERRNIDQAQADVITAQLKMNPTLNNQSLQLMSPSHMAGNSFWYQNANRQVWWQFTKQFQVAGQRENKIDFAKKNVATAEKNLIEYERNLYLDVANKWLEIWTLRKQGRIVQEAKDNIDSLVLINKLRLKNQVITETDLLRAELLANTYLIQQQTFQKEEQSKCLELKNLMGVDNPVQVDLSDAFMNFSTENVDSLIQYAFANRGDYLSVQSTIASAEANIKLQKSLAIPKPELGFIWNPQNSIPYFGLYATMPLPFFNKNQGDIQKSIVQKEQYAAASAGVAQQIKTEITVAVQRLKSQQQNLQHFSGILKKSAQILSNVKYAYLKGGTTIIDFLEAERSWLDNQHQYNDILQAYQQNYLQLLFTTGKINQLASE